MGNLTNSGNLCVPRRVQPLSGSAVSNLGGGSFRRVTYATTRTFFKRSVRPRALSTVIQSALSFRAPIIPMHSGVCDLRLFRNPALTFGSMKKHFVTHLLNCFVGGRKLGRIGILITASNSAKDTITGNFLNMPNVRICILCPGKGMDPVRRYRFAALKRGVATLRMSKAFSSYRTLIGSTFVSRRLGHRVGLASTGSVGITHFLPRSFCCFGTCTRLSGVNGTSRLMMSIPDKGFNGVATNLFTRQVKLPVGHFITTGGHGSIFLRCLRAKICAPHPSIPAVTGTVSINSPDGFTHVLSLCNGGNGPRTRVDRLVDNCHFASRRVKTAVGRICGRANCILSPRNTYNCRTLVSGGLTPGRANLFLRATRPTGFGKAMSGVLSTSVRVPTGLGTFVRKRGRDMKVRGSFRAFGDCLLTRWASYAGGWASHRSE